MSDLNRSFDRLRAGSWISSPQIASAEDASAKFQALSDGSGTYVYDEYRIFIIRMPPSLSAGAYIMEMARDPNRAINNSTFNHINEFTKRSKTDPAIGAVYDIDILGPDNGSIVLVALSEAFGISDKEGWFDIQTISCNKTGSHPENGAREFGFEATAGGYRFYTRGVSRPSNWAVRLAGAWPQKTGWTAMMEGIRDTINQRGGQAMDESRSAIKFDRSG